MTSGDTATARIRVLIVDDQELIRYGLRLVLEAEPDLIVVGEAADGAEAVAKTARLAPDVVLMDVRMPGMGGIEATTHILREHPDIRVLVVTTYDRDEFAFGALRAGAAGFLLKTASPTEIISAVRDVAQGEGALSARSARQMFEHLQADQVRQQRQAAADLVDLLTAREREVAVCVAQGQRTAEIAAALYLGEATVKTHLANAQNKLGVSNRVQLAVLVDRAGLLQA